MTSHNLYEFLGVPRDADAEQINQAFREKALLLHPDKNKTDPEAAEKFKSLTQAYQILTDPQRRKKYDATLPPAATPAVHITEIAQLWRMAGDRFFEQSARFTPAVDALRVSIPLILEEDRLLIVGMPPEHTRLIGYLAAAATQNTIRRILSELAGKSLDFRIITATTLAEWQSQKAAEEKVNQRRLGAMPAAPAGADTGPAAPSPTGDETWEELLETLMRQWAACSLRSLPQSRARFVLEQLPLLARAEDVARAKGQTEDSVQRNLARALDRLANLTGIESGVIALDYLRYRARLNGGVI